MIKLCDKVTTLNPIQYFLRTRYLLSKIHFKNTQ